MTGPGDEKSPYLFQHATNPVERYPWADEAFNQARRENKPILLSIGYSTCHWCCVMAEESFSNPETAALMSRYFINIKVDRSMAHTLMETADLSDEQLDDFYNNAGGGFFMTRNGHDGNLISIRLPHLGCLRPWGLPWPDPFRLLLRAPVMRKTPG